MNFRTTWRAFCFVVANLIWFCNPSARAIPLETWTDYVTANPFDARQVQPMAYVARGIGTDVYYVLEVDPTTGEIPVSLNTGISIDYSGTTGAAVPANAAFVGGTDGTNLRGIKTDASGELQVDVLSSALPSGAATSAKQDTGNTSLGTIDTSTAAINGKIADDYGASSGAVRTASQVGNASGVADFNSGAAGAQTLRTVLATRHESASTPVSVRISNGSSFSTPSPAGRSYADSVRNAYASTSVTTGAWVQLIASTAATINGITVFDSCGQTLELGTGAALSESRVLIIPPGGIDGVVPLTIASGTRVSVKAISGNCTTGELNITGLN